MHQDLANRIRIHALKMTSLGGSSHIGSILSVADILAVLYGGFLKYDINNPKSSKRDRFILSKGHAGAGVYAALSEIGFFPTEELKNHYVNGSIFSGHISHKGVPGVEFSTGSLGHGLPVATGIAYHAMINGKNFRTVVLLSDGECDEGSNWEAFLFASHHRLQNLICIIDYNGLQSIKSTRDTLNLEPFDKKLEAFGWNVIEVDGHDHTQLLNSLNGNSIDKPTIIIARTIKGKGVSFMENSVLWHYRTAVGAEFENALIELESK